MPRTHILRLTTVTPNLGYLISFSGLLAGMATYKGHTHTHTHCKSFKIKKKKTTSKCIVIKVQVKGEKEHRKERHVHRQTEPLKQQKEKGK